MLTGTLFLLQLLLRGGPRVEVEGLHKIVLARIRLKEEYAHNNMVSLTVWICLWDSLDSVVHNGVSLSHSIQSIPLHLLMLSLEAGMLILLSIAVALLVSPKSAVRVAFSPPLTPKCKQRC